MAKALEGDAGSDPSESPTLTAAATRMGVIMGTAAYMSPEQAKGKVVDKRADVWAFGCVLYEVLTGRRVFEGGDISEVLAGVIKTEPNWDALPADMTPALRTYLRRCLQKDPRQRVRDIGDVRLAMEGAFETPVGVSAAEAVVPQPARWRQALPWVAAVILASVITGLAVWTLTRPPAASPSRFAIVPPPGVQQRGVPRLSPDGRTVAFQGLSPAMNQVYLRPLDQLEAVPLRGTEGTLPLAFSPDGQWLLVLDATADGLPQAGGTVKRVPLTGGPATTVAEGPGGAAWGPDDDDTVVLGTNGAGLRLIRTLGGEPTPLTTLAEGERGHYLPMFLPNGRAVLFFAWSGAGTGQVAVYDFETGQRTNLLPGTTPWFATSGHLIFWREGSLWAVPFDPDRLAVEGTPVVVVDGVASYTVVNAAAYALAANGTLVYGPSDATPTSTLGWVNREGQMMTPLVDGEEIAMPRLSPEGTRVAFSRRNEGGDHDIWIRDLERGLETRLTESSSIDRYPLWSLDGKMVAFHSNRTDRYDLYSRPVDLNRETELLLQTSEQGAGGNPGAWSPDGQTLIYYDTDSSGQRDIWTLPPGGDPAVFLATAFNERAPRLSPNGKWLAYISNQAGEDRVYVTPFPDGGQVFPVSTGPATEAVWSRDGRELFYRNGDQMWVVAAETEPEFISGRPELLFNAPYLADLNAAGNPNYDVSLDGQQFLMVRSGEAAETPGFVVVENWFEELKERVPVD